jgi:hypothetical protein
MVLLPYLAAYGWEIAGAFALSFTIAVICDSLDL